MYKVFARIMTFITATIVTMVFARLLHGTPELEPWF